MDKQLHYLSSSYGGCIKPLYYKTNMDFLNIDIRDYFFKRYPDVYSKIDDLPPANITLRR